MEQDAALELGWPITLARMAAVSFTSMNGTIIHRNAIHVIPAAIMLASTAAVAAVNLPAYPCCTASLACGVFAMLGLVVTQAARVAAVERP